MDSKPTTTTGSPLKEWVKRHSPLKSRSNKPLPPTPAADPASPIRKAVAPISGNANANASTTTLNAEDKRPKKRISSILGHRKSSGSASKLQEVLSSESKATKRPRSRGKPSAADITEPPNKQPRLAQSPGSFNRLSDRVTSLEAQLQAAQKELEHFRDVPSGANSVRPSPRRAKSWDVDHEVAARQASLSGRGRFDGLVENLLVAQQTAPPLPTLSPETYHSRRGHSVDVSRVPAERARPKSRNPSAEAAFELDLKDEHERRKGLRSQLRQSSWHNIQEHMATQSQTRSFSAGSKHSLADSVSSERPTQKRKHSHEKQLPEPPTASSNPKDPGLSHPGSRGSSVPPKYLPLENQAPRLAKKHGPSARPDVIPEECDVEAHHSATDIEKAEIKTAIEVDVRPQSPWRHQVPSPSRLPAVSEEFEWNDEEIF
ncbi:MAG: hypothetical protein M1828_003188 [Chrysothrix sp. TS-e1954]|nr:MAG: hypothetical protein M1828_003188 [Chrysothrix sp. TS-e1954]